MLLKGKDELDGSLHTYIFDTETGFKYLYKNSGESFSFTVRKGVKGLAQYDGPAAKQMFDCLVFPDNVEPTSEDGWVENDFTIDAESLGNVLLELEFRCGEKEIIDSDYISLENTKSEYTVVRYRILKEN